jgi:hypothetical protein
MYPLGLPHNLHLFRTLVEKAGTNFDFSIIAFLAIRHTLTKSKYRKTIQIKKQANNHSKNKHHHRLKQPQNTQNNLGNVAASPDRH